MSVNGEDVAHCHANEQYFTWPAMLEHAARDTRLRPGDVLGSGTLTGGCLLELPPGLRRRSRRALDRAR